MKKLTKLTALALALALLLGMTAFAGTPSKVVMTDNFTTTDMATFRAQEGRRPMGHGTAGWAKNLYIIINGNGYGYDTLVKGGKYYGNNQGNFYNASFYETSNGIELRTTVGQSLIMSYDGITNQSQDAKSRQLAYIFPEEFALNTEKALVAQIDWKPYNADNASNAAYALNGPDNIYPPIGVFMDYYDTAHATPTRKTKAMAVEGIVARAGQSKISMQGAKQDTASRQPSDYLTIPFGKQSTMVTLFRPYNVLDEDNVSNAIKGKDASGATVNSLDVVKLPDRKMNIAESSYHAVATNGAIYAVHGIFYNIPSKFDIGLSNFKVYEVSLDPADFTIENSEIENVGTDDAVEIIFSQPISANMGYSSFGNNADVLGLIKILDAQGNEVPSANYSMKISERIDGDAINGVLTITPNVDWELGSTYTVTFPYGFKNIARISMLDITGDKDQLCATATFATEASASYTMTLNAYKGLAAAGNTLDALEEGTTYISVNATQTAGSPVANGNVRIEIIKDGAVVKYVTAKKAFVSNAATFGAAFKLEAGMSARAFVVGSEATATTIAAAN